MPLAWQIARTFSLLVAAPGSAADPWSEWTPSLAITDRPAVCRRVVEAFPLVPAAAGGGLPDDTLESLLAANDLAWRIETSDAAAAEFRRLFTSEQTSPQLAAFFRSIEAVARAMPRADAAGQEQLRELLGRQVRHFVGEWWRWRRGGPTPRGRPAFPVYGLPDYLRVMAEAMRLAADERAALAEVLYDLFAWNHEQAEPDVQMDHLKAMVSFLPWVPTLLEGDEQEAMIGRVAAYVDALVRCGKTFSADGAIIHHGIWHYAYASYSLPRFLDALVRWRTAGLSLSAASRDHLRRAAMVAAVLADNAGGVAPFNVAGRSGNLPTIERMTVDLLRTAALLGPDEPPDESPDEPGEPGGGVWLPAAELLAAMHPEAARGEAFAHVPRSRQPLVGIWPVNRGGTMIVRRPGWTAVVSGLSPFTGKHEIYTWTQANNYSIFVRRGGLVIATDDGNAREPGLGYGLEQGFDWSLIPGATSETRPASRLFSRRHNTFVTNSGMAVASSLGDAGCWALEQIVGPGPAFRKSLHAVGGRLTMVISGITPDDPAKPRPRVAGIPASSADATPATTLFQWPAAPAEDNRDPARQAAPTVCEHPGGGRSVRDRHGTVYCVHPDSGGILQTARRLQSQRLLYDRHLREGETSPIDWKRWTVSGEPLPAADLASISGRYVPCEGWFDLAWIEHPPEPDGTAPATIYSILPGASDEETAAFVESLSGSQPAICVVAARGGLHALTHPESGVITLAIFDPAEPLPAGLPIERASRPCTLTLRPREDGFELAAAWLPPEPLLLTLRQPTTIDAERLSLPWSELPVKVAFPFFRH